MAQRRCAPGTGGDQRVGACSRYDIDSSLIEIEINESSLIEDTQLAQRNLDSLAAAGIMMALDDFGTGFSGLSRLKQFPINTVKIDRSFIRDFRNDTNDPLREQTPGGTGRRRLCRDSESSGRDSAVPCERRPGRVVWRSARIPTDPYVYRGQLCVEVKQIIPNVFLNRVASHSAAVLAPLNVSRFVAVSDRDYQVIRDLY